ncbi:transcription repressor OFP1-like [Miscanthus floridulus]|uniref:transcription repressor OFP1-like n=1 Tax=Miscanthus floridulus TaxID=154761 RepID=UPI003457CC10
MSSWFHRLRRKTAGAAAIASAAAVAEHPAPPPCSPNRASYHVPSRDRALALPRRPAAAREDNPKLRDTRFPTRSPQPSDIVFDVVAARRDDPFSAAAAPELKLRPILTRLPPRPDADAADGGGSSSAAASPTGRARPPPRFHTAKGGAAPPDHHRRNKAAAAEACTRKQSRRLRRAGRLRWVYESLVVVKESADPEEDFLESMAEMIAANGVRSPRGLEELLACYLALNAADHHRAIVAAFRRAWLHLHLHCAPPPPPLARGRRCMHEHESCVVVD